MWPDPEWGFKWIWIRTNVVDPQRLWKLYNGDILKTPIFVTKLKVTFWLLTIL